MLAQLIEFRFSTPKVVKSGAAIDLNITCICPSADNVDLTVIGPPGAAIAPTQIPVSPGTNRVVVPLTVTGPAGLYIVVGKIVSGHSSSADQVTVS